MSKDSRRDGGRAAMTKPIDMVLHCPKCGTQHIDAPDDEEAKIAASELGLEGREYDDYVESHAWDNPPHKSHLCSECGHIWRPADVETNGVAEVKTKGKADSPIVEPMRRAT